MLFQKPTQRGSVSQSYPPPCIKMSSVFPQFVTLQKTSRKNWNIQQKTAVLLSNRENGCHYFTVWLLFAFPAGLGHSLGGRFGHGFRGLGGDGLGRRLCDSLGRLGGNGFCRGLGDRPGGHLCHGFGLGFGHGGGGLNGGVRSA